MKPVGPHLLGIEGLTAEQIHFLLDTAEQFREVNTREVKKVPTLRGKTVINCFFEASTRTRVSFEIAAKRLSTDAVNFSASSSSVSKGESLMDTVLTLEAMTPDVIVVRHPQSGAPNFMAKHITKAAIVNAGDGLHEHPTQALLDAMTIRQALGKLSGLTITLVGDVLRSRVARSNLLLHKIMGNTVRVVAPPTLALSEFATLGAEVYHDLEEALDGADVVMSLRMKHEYLKEYFVPTLEEYADKYCITEDHLARCAPNSIVLSPGPFIRGIEIASEVVDGPRSQILEQVQNGIAIRMGVIFVLVQRISHLRRQQTEPVKDQADEQEVNVGETIDVDRQLFSDGGVRT